MKKEAAFHSESFDIYKEVVQVPVQDRLLEKLVISYS